MNVRLFIVCASCFFCSWVFAASHEEKRQGISGLDKSRLPREEEQEGSRLSRTSLGAAATIEDGEMRPRLHRRTVPVDVTAPLTLKRYTTKQGITLRIEGREAGDQSINFTDQMKDVRGLVLKGTTITDTVIPLTDAITKAQYLRRVRISDSDTKDSFLFFLGSSLGGHPTIDRLVLERNRVTGTGLKSLLLGLCDMKALRHLSWRFMPIQDMVLPFDADYVKRKKGYKSFRDEHVRIQMPGETKVYLTSFDETTPKAMLQTLLKLYDQDKALPEIEHDANWMKGSGLPEDGAHLKQYVQRARQNLAKHGRDIVEETADGVSVRFKDDKDLYRVVFKDNCVVVSFMQTSAYDIVFYQKPCWHFFVQDMLSRQRNLHTLDVTGSVTVKTSEDRKGLFLILDTLENMHNLEVLGLGHISFNPFSVRRLHKALDNLRQQQSVHGQTVHRRGLKTLRLPAILPKGTRDLNDLRKAVTVTSLEELDLSGNHFGLRGLHFFGELLPALRDLKILRAGENQLFVGSDFLNRGMSEFKVGLESRKDTLEVLDLSKNHMELRDLSHIKKSLLACHNLRVLDLRGNRLTEKSLILLKELVEELPHIEHIYVGGQKIGREHLSKVTAAAQQVIHLSS